MKKQINKPVATSVVTKGNKDKKISKTKKRFLISIGGIVISTVVVVGVTIGITIAKEEVKNVT